MDISTEEFSAIPGLLSATLSESGRGMSTLELEFEDDGPSWARYEEQIVVYHKGEPLFCGLARDPVRTNDGQRRKTVLTVPNAMWVLEHQTLGGQIADLLLAQREEHKNDMRRSAIQAFASWAAMAQNVHVSAPGWALSGTISLDVSLAAYALTPNIKREGGVTAWQALLRMTDACPDCMFRVNPSGEIAVIAITKAPMMTWSSDQVLSARDLARNHDGEIVGCVAAIPWHRTQSYGVAVVKYPAGVSENSTQVPLFKCAEIHLRYVEKQKLFLQRQLQAYYEACNSPQWSGSITAEISKIDRSPLGYRLSLVGDKCHPDWATMHAICSGVTWDFKSGLVTATLGLEMGQANIAELEWDDDALGGDGEEDEENPAPDSADKSESGSRTEAGTDGTCGCGCGGGDSGTGEISETQKRFNLFMYTEGLKSNFDFGPSTFVYENPSIFPAWLTWGMTEEEVRNRLMAEAEYPGRTP